MRGDVVRIETGGGGGWGHPFDREPERVLADVPDGFVSRAERGGALRRGADADGHRGRCCGHAPSGARPAPAAKLFHRHGYHDVLALMADRTEPERAAS